MRCLPRTVLVVDDDCDLQEILREVLAPAGFEVVCRGDGASALAFIETEGRPALVLLDLMMPVMSGWEFLERVRSEPALAALPVLVVTATASHWGHPAPPEAVVQKPFDIDELVARVRAAVRGSGAAA